jgi:hypothetical protein
MQTKHLVVIIAVVALLSAGLGVVVTTCLAPKEIKVSLDLGGGQAVNLGSITGDTRAKISANENAAISTLRSIASAQHLIESVCHIDTDADGGGEFGFFGELSGSVPMRTYAVATGSPGPWSAPDDVMDPPILPPVFGDVIQDGAGGIIERQGYHFKMWLPGATAGDVTPAIAEAPNGGAAPGSYPDPNNAEILWACYAWPVTAGASGNRCFFINQEGDLLQSNNEAHKYQGLAGPSFDAAFDIATGGGDMSTSLGIAAMGYTANDRQAWTPAGW